MEAARATSALLPLSPRKMKYQMMPGAAASTPMATSTNATRAPFSSLPEAGVRSRPAAVALMARPRLSWRMAALGAWVAGGTCLLALAWWTIVRCGAAVTRQRAAGEDPGRTTVNVLVLLTSGSSLLATAALVHRAKMIAGGEGNALVALSLV